MLAGVLVSLKTLIVEDSAIYRTIIARSLRAVEGAEVIGKASNGKQALFFLKHHDVDLITLDVQMPEMDGLETLVELKRRGFEKPIVMLSGLSDQSRELTIKCLQLGALDFILKPESSDSRENQKELQLKLQKIVGDISILSARREKRKKKPDWLERRVCSVKGHSLLPPPREPKPSLLKTPSLVMIGISTGGPKALNEVISQLKGSLEFPVLIVQHMPPHFTKSLASNLNERCALEVKEAEAGEEVCPGVIYIAPGGLHMELNKTNKLSLILHKKQPVNSCRPSVDTLFFSASGLFNPGELVVLVMTGMGRDGAAGCSRLIQEGAFVGIQSEESSTIFGMPRSVAEEGNYHEIFNLSEIAEFLNSL
ncbi:MAG: chemotaxis response regulator protein-glutamate methylesterase [Acidobacteria bacterium]|nr:MAG: chemotaxis response regulator protein-glutamate methylesterase [Acidobacteriota bacterium]